MRKLTIINLIINLLIIFHLIMSHYIPEIQAKNFHLNESAMARVSMDLCPIEPRVSWEWIGMRWHHYSIETEETLKCLEARKTNP